MKHCALIGYPLGHSLSPEIHRRLFALENLDASYVLEAFPPERFLSELPHVLEYDAFNVTIPYKRDVIPHLDVLTPEAELYGAVNCVHRGGDGRLYGGNTDCGGFLRVMSENHVALNRRVCVLGAGGVGRMFAIECARQGGDVTVAVRQSGESTMATSRDVTAAARQSGASTAETSRDLTTTVRQSGESTAETSHDTTLAIRQSGESTMEPSHNLTTTVRQSGWAKAEMLRDEIRGLFSRDISVCDISELGKKEHTFELVINATPVGMFPNIGASPVPPGFLRGVKTVFDCIYNPSETLLLRQARESGCKTLGGMPMLVYQAALAHEQWFGACFDPAALTALVVEMEGLLGHE